MLRPRRFVPVLALAALFFVSAAQARQFQSSDVETSDHPAVKAVGHMGELMRERSAGRLSIRTLGAADANSEIFTVAQLRTGTLDMARVSVSALHGSVPSTVLPTLPFVFTSTAHRRRVLDGPIGEELLASFASYDVIGLCFYDAGARSIYTPGRPIRSPADVKGLKIRVQASQVMAEVMQALGAQTVPVPYAQVRARLANGTIDAAENNLISYHASHHYEAAKVYSLTEHAAPPAVVLFSKRVWDQLPADDQQIVRQAARDSVSHFRKLADEQEAAVRRSLANDGVQFVTDIDREAFLKVLAPLQLKLVLFEPGLSTLLDRIRAAQ